MIVLAIDYGTKRVGVAISRVGLAEPLDVLANDEQLFDYILQLIDSEKVEKIVIGISEQQMARKTKNFAAQLSNKTALPIEFTDETLSSQTVRRKLRSSKKQTRSGPIDHFAAAEFLQEWLDGQSGRNPD